MVKDFFKTLISPSFDDFITLKLLRILYVFGYCVWGIVVFIGGITLLVAAFETKEALGIVGGLALFLIGVPITWFIGVLFLRIWVEMIIVFFKIEENTMTLVRQGKISQPK